MKNEWALSNKRMNNIPSYCTQFPLGYNFNAGGSDSNVKFD